MSKEKVVAIVPTFNEEATIGNVLKVILDSNYFNEVIVVDGASTDKTVKISEKMGVRIIRSSEREGKGIAMKKGVKETDAEIIVFFDADLIGLSIKHISLLIEPVLKKEVVMCTGARSHWGGLPYIIAKVDPLLAIGGERAIRRFLLENMPEKFIQGYAVETTLNYFCLIKKLSTQIVKLKNLRLSPKEKKWGFLKGFYNRLKMIWQMIKIRFILVFYKNELNNYVSKNYT